MRWADPEAWWQEDRGRPLEGPEMDPKYLPSVYVELVLGHSQVAQVGLGTHLMTTLGYEAMRALAGAS